MPKDEIAERVSAAARTLDLEPLLARKPRALSGGQRQRVAMGRAIVRRPQAFLMDEPLSNLDAKLRVQMRAEIARVQGDLGTTTIYVTHDQVEAMTMGDRVAVMRKGQLQQVADPQELYDRPLNLFVAGFIGSPSMNLLEAELAGDGGGAMTLQLGHERMELPAESVHRRPALRHYAGGPVVVGIRPEHLEDAAFAPGLPRLRGCVQLREALGSELVVHLGVDARPAMTEEVRELAEDAGATAPRGASGARIVGRFSPRSRAREGEPLDIAVDTAELHFFDPQTGLGIYADDDTGGER